MKDIFRHLKRRKSKIALAVMSLVIGIYFFKEGAFSNYTIAGFLITVVLAFLIISWGSDNPEEKE
ncbi:MAG: hypothetical protein H2058_03070 [Muricauda sp.]|nr:hypothetical protein [Allomuricauda sp.]MBA4744216.1 hypothetical protein [Allomuricauda sp.]